MASLAKDRQPPPQEERQAKKQRTDFAQPTLEVGWLRNDLRLYDNPVLHEIASAAKSKGLPSLLIYIFDPRFYDESGYGRVTDPDREKSIITRQPADFSSRKCNGRRAHFYLGAIRDLQRRLRSLSTELWVFYGKPEEVFKQLAQQYGCGLEVVCLREPVSPEWTDVEVAVEAVLAESGSSLRRLWGAMSLYHEDDLPFEPKETPGSYTAVTRELGWRDLWTCLDKEDEATPIRQPLPSPTEWTSKSPAVPPRQAWSNDVLQDDAAALKTLGYSAAEVSEALSSPHCGPTDGEAGETAAWTRFAQWIAEEPEANPGGFDASDLPTSGTQHAGEVDPMQWRNLSQPHGWMQLSKYLACGCISPRAIYHELADKEHWGLPGVVHRLMWREWHRLNAIKYHRRTFWLQGPGKQNMVWIRGEREAEFAERWRTGKTGIPYIDASMRELSATGWLAYKARKTCAAFLSHDLWIDWRLGAYHFEEMLLDYDVAMNYGNWVTCVRVDKDYHGQKWQTWEHETLQHKLLAEARNDPDGSYIKAWVPELRQVPASFVHAPWAMPPAEMEKVGFKLGKDYPEPILDSSKLGHIDGTVAGKEKLTT